MCSQRVAPEYVKSIPYFSENTFLLEFKIILEGKIACQGLVMASFKKDTFV